MRKVIFEFADKAKADKAATAFRDRHFNPSGLRQTDVTTWEYDYHDKSKYENETFVRNFVKFISIMYECDIHMYDGDLTVDLTQEEKEMVSEYLSN